MAKLLAYSRDLLVCPGWPGYQALLRQAFASGLSDGQVELKSLLCEEKGANGTPFTVEVEVYVKGWFMRDWHAMRTAGHVFGCRSWQGVLDMVAAKAKQLGGSVLLAASGEVGGRPLFAEALTERTEKEWKRGWRVSGHYRAGIRDAGMIACAGITPMTYNGFLQAIGEMKQRLADKPGQRVLLHPPNLGLFARRALAIGMVDQCWPVEQLEDKGHE